MLEAILDGYTQALLVFTGIHILAAFSFYAPFKTGQVSLGQAGFMAVGAYTAGIASVKLGLSFPVGLVAAGLVSGIIGVAVGLPALRIRGIYLLLLTLGFAEIVQVVILTWEYTGGAQGFQAIPYNAYTLEYLYALLLAVLLLFGRLERSSLGRAMDSVHQDETAAEAIGVDVVRVKLFAFGLGAVLAGMAGAILAHHTTYVDANTFHILVSVELLVFVVVGGSSTYWGPVLGAAFLTLLPEFLRTLRDFLELVPVAWTTAPPARSVYDALYAFLDFENEKRLIAYGLILIAMMILRPGGLLSRDSLRRAQFVQRMLGHV